MVDPVTLTGLALAGLAGGAVASSASSGGGSAAPTPAPPPAAPPPASNPQGSAKAKPPAQQSFIGAAATPMNQSGQKTLLGQ